MKSFSRPRYRRRSSARKFRQVTPELIPGADASLHAVFDRIGVPPDQPFRPDPFQEDAVNAIENSDCLVAAPTGAGKTWIAETVTRNILENQGKTWYATPLKALTNSIHSRFITLFGKDRVGILTGDIKENQDADIIIGTTEILRNQLYDAMHRGKDLDCDVIILDEAHFLGDLDRGVVWEEIMIYLPARIPLLLLSATIGNPGQIAGWLSSIRHKPCRVVETKDRPVPLFPLFLHPSGTLLPLLEKTRNPGGRTKRLHKKVYTYVNSKKALLLSQPGKLPDLESILEIMEQYDLLPAIFFLKSRMECDQAVKLCTRKLLDRHPDRKKALKTALHELTSSQPHLREHTQRPDVEATGVASHH
ncbi:MAG: ATP-dependent DNA helicase, partial [Desulfobacterales bacterium]